ncbi:MAG: DUF29 domain-containing protein [Geminicoccaceae bacterium]
MATDMQRLYDEDFYAWTQAQARELRRFAEARPNLPLDLSHLAEEIRDLGKEQRNAVRSLVRHILVHLLLLRCSPAIEPRRGWQAEVAAARADAGDRLTATLHRGLQRDLPKLYGQARNLTRLRLEGHGEPAADLPETCPFPLAQVLDEGWYPDHAAMPRP